ncbi:helix-turn-helix transcriptional regulator [Alicyclobacillus sp.]|uniref:helix-turn-helix domain-containing protein n=1 Tax=Alicyclobacillus sp. TaxID=61169 RepID=UPI0025C4DF05|nr:helix-turn-helix transcriptional regulator [Alicyclobacillus sp.]
MASIGEKVAYLREQRGWTLKQLHERSGVSVSHISAIENGTRPNPSIDCVKRLARAFGVSLAYFDDDHPLEHGLPETLAGHPTPSAVDAPGAPAIPGPMPSPDSTENTDWLELAKRIHTLYDRDTTRFIASESSRPYLVLARQLAEQDLLHDAPHLLQVIAQFIRERGSPYGTRAE